MMIPMAVSPIIGKIYPPKSDSLLATVRASRACEGSGGGASAMRGAATRAVRAEQTRARDAAAGTKDDAGTNAMLQDIEG